MASDTPPDTIDLRPRLHVDRDTWVVAIVVPLVLTILHYFGLAPNFPRFFPGVGAPGPELALYALLWWAGCSFVGYLVVPGLILKLMGRRLSDYGFRLPKLSRHLWVYPAAYGAMVIPLLLAAKSQAFLHTYPFYPFAISHPQYWLIFELAYGVQFVALEFFFRGFVIYGLYPKLGDAAILMSMIPYCMIHFQKPLPECLGAIVAGLVLGFLAVRTRSIAGGVVIHWCVAITMDLLAVAAKTGRLPY